jgi:glucose/arabinose dehydrogenase
MLRIDVRSDAFPNDASRNYAIPMGNPFRSGGGAPEVWDYGLRNPFRNSFDRTKGNLIIADVGQDTREELDFEPVGKGGNNYGWRVREGKIQNPAFPNEPVPTDAKDPVYDYAHGGGTFEGETVIGGYVYRGSFLKAIQGEYFFADFISGKVWSMDTDPITGALLPDTVRDRTAELKRLNDFNSITSFGEDGFGNLYMVDFNGSVLAIVPEPSTYAMLLIGIMPLAWRVARGLRR